MTTKIPFRRTISNRDTFSYPDYLKEEISLLSIDKNFSRLIGSASYRIAKYPSDIDIFEEVTRCCTKEDEINFFVNGIKQVVKNIINKKYHWFLELKCGTFDKFNLNIGTYQNGYFIINHQFVKIMNDYFMVGLISLTEINEINEISKTKRPGQVEFEVVSKIVRDHYIVRWTANEVLDGIKHLEDGSILTLEEAVNHVGQINIEIIAVVNNKITDLSNYFILTYQNKDGQRTVINLPLNTYDDFYNFFLEGLKK